MNNSSKITLLSYKLNILKWILGIVFERYSLLLTTSNRYNQMPKDNKLKIGNVDYAFIATILKNLLSLREHAFLLKELLCQSDTITWIYTVSVRS